MQQHGRTRGEDKSRRGPPPTAAFLFLMYSYEISHGETEYYTDNI